MGWRSRLPLRAMPVVIGFFIGMAMGIATVGVIALVVAFDSDRQPLIAIRWDDKSKQGGSGFYAAEVHAHYDRLSQKYRITALVRIGHGNNYFHPLGELGQTSTIEEALELFGTIQWEEKGVTIGDLNNGGVFLDRKLLEKHR